MEEELKNELNSTFISGKEYLINNLPEGVLELLKSDKHENVELGVTIVASLEGDFLDNLYMFCVETKILKHSNLIIEIIIEKIIKGEVELINDLEENTLNQELIEELSKLINIK